MLDFSGFGHTVAVQIAVFLLLVHILLDLFDAVLVFEVCNFFLVLHDELLLFWSLDFCL